MSNLSLFSFVLLWASPLQLKQDFLSTLKRQELDNLLESERISCYFLFSLEAL